MISFRFQVDSYLSPAGSPVTSRQQHSQLSLTTSAPASKSPPTICKNLKANQTATSLIITSFLILVIYSQPLLAQTEVPQPLPSQTDNEAIKREILLLGDADPIVRKNARTAIEGFGDAAIGELKKAAKFETTKDYETQIMAAKILAVLQDAIALEEAEEFVRGEKELEGWPAFKKLTGDTTESRSLFRDIYLQNREDLLRATGTQTPGTQTTYTASYSQIHSLIQSPELAQVCFGMFLLVRKQTAQKNAEANATVQPGPSLPQIKQLFRTLATQNSPLAKLDDQSLAPAMLVRAIIESAPQTPQLLASQISLLRQIKSKEISSLLLDFAVPENPTVIRLAAIQHAIKVADKATFKKLNVYFDDTTEVGKYLVLASDNKSSSQPSKQLISQVQIRDVILLGNLRLGEQDHTEFGFRADAIDAATNKLDVKQAGFVDNEKRNKAFERFRRTIGNSVPPKR